METDLRVVLAELNRMQREDGRSAAYIDRVAKEAFGVTRGEIAAAVRRMPKVPQVEPLKTADLLYSGLRGASLGLLPSTQRQKDLRGVYATEMKALDVAGKAALAVGTGTALTTIPLALRVGVGQLPRLLAGAKWYNAAQRLSPTLSRAPRAIAKPIAAGGKTLYGVTKKAVKSKVSKLVGIYGGYKGLEAAWDYFQGRP
jgi:hypothetical protein